MKNFKFLIVLSCFLTLPMLKAQKIGVVDTDYVLNNMPQFKAAEARLDAQIETWQQEIKASQELYEQKKAAFENEKILLVGEQLKMREQEVKDLGQNIKTTISLRFGTNGEIQKLREQLVQPFQDQIWDAVKTISEKKGLGIVLDKSNDVNVLFLNKRYDYTENVLDLLTKEKKTEKK